MGPVSSEDFFTTTQEMSSTLLDETLQFQRLVKNSLSKKEEDRLAFLKWINSQIVPYQNKITKLEDTIKKYLPNQKHWWEVDKDKPYSLSIDKKRADVAFKAQAHLNIAKGCAKDVFEKPRTLSNLTLYLDFVLDAWYWWIKLLIEERDTIIELNKSF